jgi:hypothetical protein
MENEIGLIFENKFSNTIMFYSYNHGDGLVVVAITDYEYNSKTAYKLIVCGAQEYARIIDFKNKCVMSEFNSIEWYGIKKFKDYDDSSKAEKLLKEELKDIGEREQIIMNIDNIIQLELKPKERPIMLTGYSKMFVS